MGKLSIALEKQLKTENKQDAEDCIKIYNHLYSTTNHVWESDWNPLVTVRFEGKYPNCIRIYKPTYLGYLVIKDIEKKD